MQGRGRIGAIGRRQGPEYSQAGERGRVGRQPARPSEVGTADADRIRGRAGGSVIANTFKCLASGALGRAGLDSDFGTRVRSRKHEIARSSAGEEIVLEQC